MKYIDEYRDKDLVKMVADKIRRLMPPQKVNIMEVCGTHTQSVFKFGLNKLLPANLNLIAGPGCPVCVSSQGYIDAAIRLARDKRNIILTFGDMLRVPGKKSTLEEERAKGAGVHMAYSPMESLTFALKYPDKKVIFLAVGFETTAPAIALTLLAAKKQKLKNILFFSSLKLMPPVMRQILKDRRLRLDGFLLPGHVSSIIGSKAYEFIPREYGKACCVAGFEPLDLMEGVYFLLRQIAKGRPGVENQYIRVVTRRGNPTAQGIIKRVFRTTDVAWRGLGMVAESGLAIRDVFRQFDARKVFGIRDAVLNAQPATQCLCAEVLKGIIVPEECPLFRKSCTPVHPIGPCMVSFEGACNAHYKYGRI